MKHIYTSNDYIWDIEQRCLKLRTREMTSASIWIYSHFNHDGYRRRYYDL